MAQKVKSVNRILKRPKFELFARNKTSVIHKQENWQCLPWIHTAHFCRRTLTHQTPLANSLQESKVPKPTTDSER
jgi:hypothetical protein